MLKALFPAALLVDDSIRRIFPAKSASPSRRRLAHFTRASEAVPTRRTLHNASSRASSGMKKFSHQMDSLFSLSFLGEGRGEGWRAATFHPEPFEGAPFDDGFVEAHGGN